VGLSFPSSTIQNGQTAAVTSLFITGGNGFVGRALVNLLSSDRFDQVYSLVRTPGASAGTSKVTALAGTLHDIGKFEHELGASDAVIHLAAVTGKAAPAEYFATNVDGTRKLIDSCRRAGVSRFVYVSSIAVNFPDKRRYYYAESKQQAEELVRKSGLRYTIVRPTMILGPGSPILAGLQKLARTPVTPIFGEGTTPVQPIDVDDLAQFLLIVLNDEALEGKTVEFGGPEAVSVEALVMAVRQSLHGSKRARIVHVPMAIALKIAVMAETLAYPLTPITVGQLATFRFDGTAESNPLFERQVTRLKSINQTLGRSIVGEASRNETQLRRECRILVSYLSGTAASAYITEKYVDAHQRVPALKALAGFDTLMVRLASIHPAFTRVIDSYAQLFAPTSALRNKLVLTLALLETSGTSDKILETVDSGSKAKLSLILLGHGLRFLFCLAAGIVILTPFRLLATGKRTQAEGH
jgi:nucleoside-diphosphate-sugar epimerase